MKSLFNNVGTADRMIRLAVGGILLYLGLSLYAGSALGIGLTAVGAIATLTGTFGSCALYGLLGLNTRKSDQSSQS